MKVFVRGVTLQKGGAMQSERVYNITYHKRKNPIVQIVYKSNVLVGTHGAGVSSITPQCANALPCNIRIRRVP
eukprot:1183057-Prorocentrum_minimum.AAC.6